MSECVKCDSISTSNLSKPTSASSHASSTFLATLETYSCRSLNSSSENVMHLRTNKTLLSLAIQFVFQRFEEGRDNLVSLSCDSSRCFCIEVLFLQPTDVLGDI